VHVAGAVQDPELHLCLAAALIRTAVVAPSLLQ
jgi:hypothetical protein